jgi:hypothetical protein
MVGQGPAPHLSEAEKQKVRAGLEACLCNHEARLSCGELRSKSIGRQQHAVTRRVRIPSASRAQRPRGRCVVEGSRHLFSVSVNGQVFQQEPTW